MKISATALLENNVKVVLDRADLSWPITLRIDGLSVFMDRDKAYALKFELDAALETYERDQTIKKVVRYGKQGKS